MNTKKAKPSIPAKKLELYTKLLAGFPDIEVKGAEMPYTSHNGNMFSFLNENGELSLRLSETDRQSFIQRFNTKLSERHGTVLKEYVHVPDSVFVDPQTMRKYMIMSTAYARTLKRKTVK
jgi:hypothetical protein